ncbi:hypothetical protein [Candidatus Cyanaurora vandensis]|uniref:hypothetical protein n=1 Tax=Candidatus Cyanaurora vandensis TaxID=2714958 RepID=UPI00257F132E|nr:hypothetical protein [Candidatus Cyanaurora vandensis]
MEFKLFFKNLTLVRHSVLAGLVSLVFFALAGFGIGHHEMWLDELQAWQIARTSNSLGELFANLRYEGHPGLWHLGLFLLSRFSPEPWLMQVYHLFLATAGVYIFVRYAPFTSLQRVLFVFGYFTFYEYSLISRGYGLGMLLIFIFCALYQAHKPYRWLVLVLVLLANTSVYGLLIALTLGLGLVLEPGCRAKRWWLATAVGALGVVILQVLPPPDKVFGGDWQLRFDLPYLAQILSVVWQSYLPIPQFTLEFWNTNWLLAAPGGLGWAALGSLGLGLTSWHYLGGHPLARRVYLLGSSGVLLFTYLVYYGSLRHHGHLFVLWIACFWLSAKTPAPAGRDQFINVVLGVQAVAGVLAFSLDVRYPFSTAQAMARLIQQQDPDWLLVGSRDYALSPVAGYLDRAIYYPESGRFNRFVVWDRERQQELSFTDLAQRATAMADQQQKSVLLVVNYVPITFNRTLPTEEYIWSSQPLPLRLEPLPVDLPPSILGDSDFRLYRIRPR